MNIQPGQTAQKYFSMKVICRIAVCLLFMFIIFLQAGCIKKQELPKLVMEIKKEHDNQKQARLDITKTVQRFIPKDASVKKAVEYLEQNKFNISPATKEENIILASFRESFYISYFEYKIYIYPKNEKIDHLSAERVLTAL